MDDREAAADRGRCAGCPRLMRGGFVACFGAHDPKVLERAAAAFRWHRGRGEHWEGHGLAVDALIDHDDGPTVEIDSTGIRLVYGAPIAPLAQLEAGDGRFAALESDGRVVQASRDAFGLAPLFYRPFRGAMWFSTEMAPLVSLGGTGPDLEALVGAMAYHPCPVRTGWRDIWRVLPGERVQVNSERRVSSTVHWDPVPLFGTYRGSRSEALVEFRERLAAAVERSVAEDCGLMLSGGFDSAAVAVLAPPSARPPRCVHVTFPSLPVTDEHVYARDVAEAASAPLQMTEGPVTPWDPYEDLDAWGCVPYNWLPYGIEESALGKMAAEGLTVALDGHDGDGVVGHPGGEWGELAMRGELRRIAELTRSHGPKAMVAGLVVDLLPPRARVLALRRLRHGPTVPERSERYLGDSFGASLRNADHHRWGRRAERWRVKQLQPLRPGATFSMEQKELFGARFGIDVRHPFASRHLASLMISLPCGIKADPQRPKAFVADALSDMLPACLRERRRPSNYLPVVAHRVDIGRCVDLVRASGIRLPFIDYERLFRDADEEPERLTVFLLVSLARAHAFAVRATG